MKVVIDTSLYIDFLRKGVFLDIIKGIYTFRRASIYFSSVVIEELLQGVLDSQGKKFVEALYHPFEKARRIMVPTHRDWKETGNTIAKLRQRRKDLKQHMPGLINDVLITTSAHSQGAVVYTANKKDFELIASIKPFHYKVVNP